MLEKSKRVRQNKYENGNKLAQFYYYLGKYTDGIAISDVENKETGNMLLSLHLCLNDRINFNRCANKLAYKQWLNPQGIAAIDHGNILYNQKLDNGLGGKSTFDSVYTQTINKQELSDSLIHQIIARLLNGSMQSKFQGHLANGSQTYGNILELDEEPFKILKKLLIEKIDTYNQLCDINADKNFKNN